MKKILIALDYDATSQTVAEQGYALAKSMNAEVVLLHVIYDSLYLSPYMSNHGILGTEAFLPADFVVPDISEKLVRSSLLFLDRVRHHLKDDTIQLEVIQGDIVDVILETAKKTKSDLIVMGTHSRRWMEDIMLGSIAHKIMKHSELPVFVVPTKFKEQKKTN